MSTREDPIKAEDFLESLSSFSKLHRSQKWEGTFGEFLAGIVAANPAAAARSSHQYIWDMLRWHGDGQEPGSDSSRRPAPYSAVNCSASMNRCPESSITSRPQPQARMSVGACCCCWGRRRVANPRSPS